MNGELENASDSGTIECWAFLLDGARAVTGMVGVDTSTHPMSFSLKS
jgi:hypothetical protein